MQRRRACARANLIHLLLLSAQPLHAGAIEPDENAVLGVVLLQTDFRLSVNAESAASAALQPGTQKFSISAFDDNNVSSNARRDSLDKLNTTISQKDIKHKASLWPLALLVIGTVGSFVAMILFGHLHLPEKELTPETAVVSRECFADHAKWLLAGLVCFGHLTQYWHPVIGGYQPISGKLASGAWSHPSNQFFTFIHLFVMQTFCFYSGHFSRSYAQFQQDQGGLGVFVSTRRLQFTLLNILLVGEIMTILASGVERGVQGEPVLQLQGFLLGQAGWYIYALVMWRLFLPTWKCVQYPIAVSLLLALVVSPPPHGTMARTLSYFPFFVMGLRMDPCVLRKMCSDGRVQISGVALLVLMLVTLRWSTSHPYLAALHGDGAEGENYWGILHWPMYYMVGSLAIGSFIAGGQLALGGSWGPLIDNMSRRSLYAYLGHYPILSVLNAATGWQGYMMSLAPPLQLVFSLAISFMVLMIITSWPVYFVLSSVCEPNLAWLFEPATPMSDADTSGK